MGLMELKDLGKRKQDAVETLAGGVAHNFNNLLMAIQGRASLIMKDMKPSHPYYRHLSEIMKCVDKGSQITSQLLGYAGEGQFFVEPVDLNRLVELCLDEIDLTDNPIDIYLDMEVKSLRTHVDRDQFCQVLLNILDNAAKAMPEGGELSIATEELTIVNGAAESLDMHPGLFARITVTDTGLGMDEETTNRIFEPFYTADGSAQAYGKGMGMAESYGVIRKHGGIIDVWSTPGVGTTFSILLPIMENPGALKDQFEDEQIVMGFETILLVDDEEVLLDVGREVLEELGYRVVTAVSGEDAIEKFQTGENRFDLVILDMIMPDLDGLETFIHLQSIDPDVKVLVSTGYKVDENVQKMMELGCRDYILKPYNISELSSKLRVILCR